MYHNITKIDHINHERKEETKKQKSKEYNNYFQNEKLNNKNEVELKNYIKYTENK